MPSILEQYRISDFIEWHREKRLELSHKFQRGPVWKPAARTYLIDTILRELPIPKVFLRTRIDTSSKKSVREVVDGQQRLRAILDFANDELVLSSRAGEFAKKKYSTLSDEEKQRFLAYPIAVDQLVNASDDDVLEVFGRINSYSVTLNHAETRHVKFQGEFKWSVHKSTRAWSTLWEKFHVVTVQQRVRMLDDQLMAEMYGVLLAGVTDGGQPRITGLYKKYDGDAETVSKATASLDKVLKVMCEKVLPQLGDTPLSGGPHFLMLFAAVAHAVVGIPRGEMGDSMPNRPTAFPENLDVAIDNLRLLASIVGSEEVPTSHEDFWSASKSSTQRISSRIVRFPILVRALANSNI